MVSPLDGSLFITLALGLAAGLLLSFLAELLRRRVRKRREITDLIRDLVKSERDVEYADAAIAPVLESEDRDKKATFIVLTGEVEKSLRSLASKTFDVKRNVPLREVIDLLCKREILDSKWQRSFRYLWHIRNKVIHGVSATDPEIELGTTLAASLLVDFEKIKKSKDVKS